MNAANLFLNDKYQMQWMKYTLIISILINSKIRRERNLQTGQALIGISNGEYNINIP